jgi:hypothetical protein
LIDIRSNNGGDPYLAYDLFKQLFPSQVPFSSTRYRAHTAADALGEAFSTLGPVTNGGSVPADESALLVTQTSDFNYRNLLKSPDGANFTSWADLYGPVEVHGDNFTNLASNNFFNQYYDLASWNLVVSGYGNRSNIPSDPFDASQITLVSSTQTHHR